MPHAIRFHKTGGPEVLAWEEIQIGKPGPGEARIRHTAVGLNFIDIYNRSGLYPVQLPSGLGGEAAGVVEEVGPGVTDWKAGDRVVIDPGISCGHCEFCRSGRENLCNDFKIMGEETSGTYAEYIVVSERNLLKLPDAVSYRQAAAASLVYLTAWHSLITRGGERFFVVFAFRDIRVDDDDPSFRQRIMPDFKDCPVRTGSFERATLGRCSSEPPHFRFGIDGTVLAPLGKIANEICIVRPTDKVSLG